jgi:hypothetical protein
MTDSQRLFSASPQRERRKPGLAVEEPDREPGLRPEYT